MAVDLGTVFFSLDAKMIQVDKAQKALAQTHKQSMNLAKELKTNTNPSLKRTQTLLKGFAALYIGAKLISIAHSFLSIADRGTQLSNRIAAVTKTTEEYTRANAALLAISQRTGTVIANNAKLYQRLSISAKSLGASQEDILAVTETVANIGRISGSTAEDVKNSTRQLAQGLGSTFFRAEEFNSVIEQMPALIDRVATELGMTSAQMNIMVKKGKLLGRDVFRGILLAQQKAREEAGKLPLTLQESGNLINNLILTGITQTNNKFRITSTIAGTMKTLTTLWSASIRDGAVAQESWEEAQNRTSKQTIRALAYMKFGLDTLSAVWDAIVQDFKFGFKYFNFAIKTTFDGWVMALALVKDKYDEIMGNDVGAPAKEALKQYKNYNNAVIILQRALTKEKEKYLKLGKDDPAGEKQVATIATLIRNLEAAKEKFNNFLKTKTGEKASNLLAGLSESDADNFAKSYANTAEKAMDVTVGVVQVGFTQLKIEAEKNIKELTAIVEEESKKQEKTLANATTTQQAPKFELSEFEKLVKKTNQGKLMKIEGEIVQLTDYISKFGKESIVGKEGVIALNQALDALKKKRDELSSKELHDFLKGGDFGKLQDLNKQIGKLSNYIKKVGDDSSVSAEALQGLKDRLSDLRAEAVDLQIDGFNQAFEGVGKNTSQKIVDKIFGRDNMSTKEIAEQLVGDLLSNILNELLTHKLLNPIKNAIVGLIDGGSGAQQIGQGTGLLSSLGGLFSASPDIANTVGAASNIINQGSKSVNYNIYTTESASSMNVARSRYNAAGENMMRNS